MWVPPSENFPANNSAFSLSVAVTTGMASIGTQGTMGGILPAGSLSYICINNSVFISK